MALLCQTTFFTLIAATGAALVPPWCRTVAGLLPDWCRTGVALVPDLVSPWCRTCCRTVAPAAKVNNRCGKFIMDFTNEEKRLIDKEAAEMVGRVSKVK